jgi:predicted RNase H-like nuclease
MIAAVDGCRDGWLVAIAGAWPCPDPVRFLVCSNFSEVRDATTDCFATVIDIPIGLPAGSEYRKADLLARTLLKETGSTSSVFFTPPRATLDANSPIEFQRLHREAAGRGAGIPVWGIVPKIRDVDGVMSKDPHLQERIYEFHPELAWRRICGTSLSSKLSAMGALQRLQVLYERCPGWLSKPPDGALKRSGVSLDDVLDAVVGLFAAQCIVDGRRCCLPEGEPPRDERGLQMVIWY